MEFKDIVPVIKSHLYVDVDANTINTLSMFLILWGIYESRYHKKGHPQLDGSTKYSIDFKTTNISEQNIQIPNIDQHFALLQSRYCSIKGKKLYDSLGMNGSYNNSVYNLLMGSKSEHSKHFAIQVIMAQLRNNLFHGIKDIGSLNSNKEVFDIMNNVLHDKLSTT